jgi:hypothetical protein
MNKTKEMFKRNLLKGEIKKFSTNNFFANIMMIVNNYVGDIPWFYLMSKISQ